MPTGRPRPQDVVARVHARTGLLALCQTPYRSRGSFRGRCSIKMVGMDRKGRGAESGTGWLFESPPQMPESVPL
jgi:hypothetical protein